MTCRTSRRTSCVAASPLLVLTLLVAGCGKDDPPRAPTAPARKAAAAAPGTQTDLSAREVAQAVRRDLVCPARITSPARKDGTPVDDVLGVRPGLGYDEAMAAVLCTHELLVGAPDTARSFRLQAAQAASVRQGFNARTAEPRIARSSQQILKDLQRDAMARGANAVREDLKPGQATWSVATMGLPGQEKVLSVAREERYADGQGPTVDALIAALQTKYGTPTYQAARSATQHPVLRWAHDPQGRPVTAGSPLLHQCIGISDPKAGINLHPDCGVVVQALLLPRADNPALVDRLQVGVVDQAGGYRLVNATEQGLGQSDTQRRAKEVDHAARTAKPSL